MLTGASSQEVLQMFGDWGAGFAGGVSGGYLTDVYEHYSGKKVEPKHGMLFNAGTITGVGVSFLLGMKLPVLAATKLGSLRWVAVAGTAVDTAFDVYGAAQATQNLHQSYQEDGKWEAKDAWNLLSYVPFAGMILGVKKGIGAARKVQGSAQGVDDVLAAKNVKTTVEGGNPLRCSSFIAGTEILTTEGEKNIEDIEIGDWVIADDPTTPGEIEARQVLNTFSREASEVFDLYVDGEIISTTAEHAFWTRDEGWVDASDLEVGDWLQTDEETFVDVDRIERREEKTKVYNFSVEGIPTYFVSEHGILVHNACVYTTTNSRVDLNRPEGTYVTRENITEPRTLYRHISRHVPPTSRRRGQFFLDYVTEIDVPEEALGIDPGGIPGVTAWIPPNTNGARITREWSVTEAVIGEPPIIQLLDE